MTVCCNKSHIYGPMSGLFDMKDKNTLLFSTKPLIDRSNAIYRIYLHSMHTKVTNYLIYIQTILTNSLFVSHQNCPMTAIDTEVILSS